MIKSLYETESDRIKDEILVRHFFNLDPFEVKSLSDLALSRMAEKIRTKDF